VLLHEGYQNLASIPLVKLSTKAVDKCVEKCRNKA